VITENDITIALSIVYLYFNNEKHVDSGNVAQNAFVYKLYFYYLTFFKLMTLVMGTRLLPKTIITKFRIDERRERNRPKDMRFLMFFG